MRKIDDEYDAAKSQYPEVPANIPAELAIRIGGVVLPIVGIVNVVRDYYSQAAVAERLGVLVDAVNSKVNAVEAKIEGPEFAEAVRIAIEEAWRTTDADKVKRFGAILGNSAASSTNPDSPNDAVEFIRTVGQLGDRDIQALNLLYSTGAVRGLMQSFSNLHDPNPFIDAWADVVRAAAEDKLALDDFYSSRKRLEGFGLAIELPRNPRSLSEYSSPSC